MQETLELVELIMIIVLLSITGFCVLFVIVLNIIEYRQNPKITFWQAVKKTWLDIIEVISHAD